MEMSFDDANPPAAKNVNDTKNLETNDTEPFQTGKNELVRDVDKAKPKTGELGIMGFH